MYMFLPVSFHAQLDLVHQTVLVFFPRSVLNHLTLMMKSRSACIEFTHVMFISVPLYLPPPCRLKALLELKKDITTIHAHNSEADLDRLRRWGGYGTCNCFEFHTSHNALSLLREPPPPPPPGHWEGFDLY